jgi:hypothetical protein
MPLAERYRHWQQAPDDELLDYDATATEPVPDTVTIERVTWEHIPWRNADADCGMHYLPEDE